jgi:hypothetical protein
LTTTWRKTHDSGETSQTVSQFQNFNLFLDLISEGGSISVHAGEREVRPPVSEEPAWANRCTPVTLAPA